MDIRPPGGYDDRGDDEPQPPGRQAPQPMDILDDLTPAQREAVTHVDGPLLVLAGAGSGKTRVITRRVAYLIAKGVRPHQVLAITFTNKAAGEMRERVDALVPGARRPMVRTFHSFCARMLREYADLVGLDPSYTIYDMGDQRAALKQALAELNLDPTHFSPDRILAEISRAKNRLERAREYARRTAGDWAGKRIARVFEAYERILAENRALDFDDLLLEMALGLRSSEEFRHRLQDRFRYILIDEYQDTNHAQYVLARDLAGPRRNLCATGDPDQSIYGWRGAELSNILDFEEDFPDAKVVRLERNYRSTKTILAAASGLIAHNVGRKEKALYTENPGGVPVAVVQTDDEEAEARSIVARIVRLHDEGRAYGDAAVFVRTGAQTRALEDAFRQARPPVPYEIVRGSSFYDRKEVRDVVAYLQVLHNPRDEVNLRRIINTPSRGIGKKTVEVLEAWADREGIGLLEATRHAADIEDLGSRARGAVNRFAGLMGKLAETPPDRVAPLVERVVEETGYARSLKKDDNAAERRANLDELITLAARFDQERAESPVEGEAEAPPEEAHGRPPLEAFLETVNLSSEQDAYDEAADRVPLMTLHAAKGLEFPAVFVAGCEDHLLPHAGRSDEPADVEEERRLLFVGMTRAQEVLTLAWARYRRIRGRLERCVPSRFLAELPAEPVRTEDERTGTFPERAAGRPGYRRPGAERPVRPKRDEATGLSTGELVRHKTYGLGRVRRFETQGGRRVVRVRFNTAGEKLLDPEYARLERVASA